ncbi:hypothetical protein F5X98DRAFT_332923 [Xylaria grammica]|nr:hypothetical protein F5X98DRAFT_332923 [Xylaria grammica]
MLDNLSGGLVLGLLLSTVIEDVSLLCFRHHMANFPGTFDRSVQYDIVYSRLGVANIGLCPKRTKDSDNNKLPTLEEGYSLLVELFHLNNGIIYIFAVWLLLGHTLKHRLL